MAKNRSIAAEAEKNTQKKLGTHSLALIITAAVLIVTLLTGGIVFLVKALREDKWFDYVKTNMNRYIELPKGAYKDYELELSIARPHEIDIDVSLLNLISSEEFRKLKGDGTAYSNIAVTAGDKLVIRYRGYTIDENGKQTIVSSSMSNIPYSSATEIQIGVDNPSLPIGFELGLIGKNPKDYVKFEKITSGKLADQKHSDKLVLYVSAERLPTASIGTDNEKKDTATITYARIDLEDTDIAKNFGEGFLETVKTYTIGQSYSFGVTLGEGDEAKEYTYRDFVINFATSCEKEETSEGEILTVEGYFAYDYGTDGTAIATLRNQTVYYDVWIDRITPYDTVINNISVDRLEDITDEVIKHLVSRSSSELTEEELNKYDGEGLVEKYKSYIKKCLDDIYDETYELMIEDALWDRLLAEAKVKKYPKSKVEDIYAEYEEDVYYQFDYTGGTLQDYYTESTKTYETIDEFAVAYLQISEDSDWRETLYTMSESLVKERLILYYILQTEDILPSEEQLNSKVNEIKQEYLDEYIKQYVEKMQASDADYSIDDLSDEEYKEFLEERKSELFDYYDDDYFKETAYYEIAIEILVKYPSKVYTLDDPKPTVDK